MTRKSQKVTAKFTQFLVDSVDRLEGAYLNADIQGELLKDSPLYGSLKERKEWPVLLFEGVRVLHGARDSSPEKRAYDVLFDLLQKEFGPGGNDEPTHQDKRSLARKLGLLRTAYAVTEILKDSPSFEEGSKTIATKLGVKVVLRNRDPDHPYKQHYRLIEDPRYARPGEKTILCTPENGFYHVVPEESVIFVSSEAQSSHGPYKLELVVLRDVLAESDITQPILDWLTAVVCTATANRRNVRPTHPGMMVQAGLNMGARHARALGWAKSFTKKLDSSQKVAQDTDLIGALSLLWNLSKAYLPSEIMKEWTEFLDSLEYPTLGTQNVPPGQDFSIEYEGQRYTFTSNGRAPPEGIATWAFHMPSHKDKSPLAWSLALTSMRQVLPQSPLAPGLGSNLVDLSLRVVVQSRTGTLTAFNPNELHGTTSHGSGVDPVNAGVSLTMTQRVYNAYMVQKERGCVVFKGEPVTHGPPVVE